MSRSKKGGSDYEVGYGRPPKQWQFKKGQSGNMHGRPIKDKTPIRAQLNDALVKALSRNISIAEPDGTVRNVSIPDALALKAVSNALTKDKPRALELLLKQSDLAAQENDDQAPIRIIVEGGFPI